VENLTHCIHYKFFSEQAIRFTLRLLLIIQQTQVAQKNAMKIHEISVLRQKLS